ncbi:MAG TPA: sulfite exporter TauE/SafE family protein [Vicinamibacterales bacterium]|nr:sulfite exporter TauE/SafE family protein [Vicinamibacterales bacterium]
MDSFALPLAAITLAAAIVNGALGYGFSSITVPLALLFLTNRVLNPALIPIEVALNAYILWVNRDALPNVWRRVLPIVIGLAPGVLVGTALVSFVNPGWLKFGTFIALLPLILFQAAGFRRPIRSERSVGLAFGGGVGVLYSVTTISGPPLAVMLSNQGLTKKDFRAALGFIRLAESLFTGVAYAYAGLYSVESMKLIPYILPSIAIGVPIGAFLIQRIRPETFRRVCMSFDAWIVGFGLSTLLQSLELVESDLAYLVLVAVGMLDTGLLYRFFTVQLPLAKRAEALLSGSPPVPARGAGGSARVVADPGPAA